LNAWPMGSQYCIVYGGIGVGTTKYYVFSEVVSMLMGKEKYPC